MKKKDWLQSSCDVGNRSGSATRYIIGIASVSVVLLAGILAWRGVTFAMVNAEEDPAAVCYRHFSQPYVPDVVELAGERVPLECIDVREALEWEMCVIANWHSQVLLILKRAPRYFGVIEPILRAYGVPEDMKYLAVVESNLFDRAYSPSHAAGIWQFLEGTAREYGLEVNEDVDERYNVRLSTHAACRYLKDSHEQFGSWAMAASAYNMGRNALQKQVERQGERSFYNLLVGVETSRYVYRLIAFKLILENPARYGLCVDSEDCFPMLPVKQVEVDSTIENLAEFAKSMGANYKTLKWLNPWLRTNSLPVKGDKKYMLEFVDTLNRRKEIKRVGGDKHGEKGRW